MEIDLNYTVECLSQIKNAFDLLGINEIDINEPDRYDNWILKKAKIILDSSLGKEVNYILASYDFPFNINLFPLNFFEKNDFQKPLLHLKKDNVQNKFQRNIDFNSSKINKSKNEKKSLKKQFYEESDKDDLFDIIDNQGLDEISYELDSNCIKNINIQ